MDSNPSDQGTPFQSPVQPTELALDSEIQFDCHRGIACFNECCRNIDIQLTPYDILRLKRCLALDSREFVARYTLPFEMDFHSMPGLKMATKPGTTECVFLSEEGCSVYQDRPAACRYYALGAMGVRKKEEPQVTELYFLVKEAHCLGHDEPVTRTVGEYRKAQGVDTYDEMNRDWRDLIIKKRSSGPTIGMPSQRSMQLFDMCSYDLDSFGEFIQSKGFRNIFDLDEADLAELLGDDEKLLRFSIRFLKQVLFGERSIPVKAGARAQRVQQRREIWNQRREREVARSRESLEDLKYQDRHRFRAKTPDTYKGGEGE